MLTKPEDGWVNVQLEGFSERASYMTDIPNDCLDAFIYALQNNLPTVIFFDAEGWDFNLVASWYQSYVILDKDNVKVFEIKKDLFELANELYEDINNNLNDWLNWDYVDDEEELKEYREKLITKLNTLGAELAKREKGSLLSC